MNAQLKIDRARWFLLTEQPFYGSLSMRLDDVLTTSVPRSATNGKVIKWNPDYLETITDEEVRYVLLHETLHNSNGHLWRMSLDALSNEAGDYEIALILEKIPGIKRPENVLYDEQYEDMACEEIRGRLQQQQQDENDQEDDDEAGQGSGPGQQSQPGQGDKGGQQSQPGGQPESGHGEEHGCTCWEEPTAEPGQSAEAAAQELQDDWETAVVQAVQAAQALGQGDVPGDLQRVLDRIRHQEVDWRREMADFVKDSLSTRNDWSRSARRHAWQPVIYPRRMVDSMGTVIFARDTSRSINNEICAEFSALVTDAVSELGCKGIVIDCDARIQDEIEVNDYQSCPLTAKGGGGTDFRPVFNRAEELVAMGEQISGIVYLTDLLGPAPEDSEIPTLWISTSKGRPAPFGRVVEINGAR